MKIKDLKALLANLDDNANVIVSDEEGRFYSLDSVLTLKAHCNQYGCEEHAGQIYADLSAEVNPVIFDIS